MKSLSGKRKKISFCRDAQDIENVTTFSQIRKIIMLLDIRSQSMNYFLNEP